MLRRLTSRRTLQWAGTIACVLLAAVFIASRWYEFDFSFTIGTHGLTGDVAAGCICVQDLYFEKTNPGGYWEQVEERTPRIVKLRGWEGVFHPKFRWWPNYFLRIGYVPAERWAIVLPLWIPFLLLAIPTAWLWRLDRRRPLPGHCGSCNYDLTGNTSGVCPECGAAVPPANSALLQSQPPV